MNAPTHPIDRVDHAVHVREQAEALLEVLVHESRQSNERMREMKRDDPIRRITGRSALEHAITNLHGAIEQMDRLISEAHEELPFLQSA